MNWIKQFPAETVERERRRFRRQMLLIDIQSWLIFITAALWIAWLMGKLGGLVMQLVASLYVSP